MKKLILFTFLGISFIGCTTKEYKQSMKLQKQTGIILQSDFNNETYIWENWIFPSNKTTGR